CQKYDISPFIF
nr:immunoglobulin light chain junction region [Macaca mulatta]MOX49169.1 immunoglobulin light chain junction region [Macaca mulatta]MOX50003.1 immunoglobulin light chain junction region [Macaca mulatta]MOX50295.1 immunoglobulin light chain junction region [Macaca mulatta]MOX50325.1 immunoglobulin light chain junction region [Macaca mulatta]